MTVSAINCVMNVLEVVLLVVIAVLSRRRNAQTRAFLRRLDGDPPPADGN